MARRIYNMVLVKKNQHATENMGCGVMTKGHEDAPANTHTHPNRKRKKLYGEIVTMLLLI